ALHCVFCCLIFFILLSSLLFGCGGKLSLTFFFSSRRRHTRSKRDWSSDVCSSDLSSGSGVQATTVTDPEEVRGALTAALNHRGRSEERRVGKECRSRGSSE